MFKQMHRVVLLAGLLLIAALQPAVAGDFLTYQGRLTDPAGNPVPNASYAITFRIYNTQTGGTSLWSDQFASVQTSSGLFEVVLGSQTSLDLASMGDTTLYLQIQVGGDLPLMPRVLLTSSPKAAVAGKVIGDIVTSQGAMLIKTNDGDSSIVFGSFQDMASIKMFDPQPEPPGRPIVELNSDATNGAALKLFDPQPEPPGKAMEILSGMGTGPSIRMFDALTGAPVNQRLEISSSAINGASILMFDPQPEPPGKLFEINATSGSGPSMSFFDLGGQVMGVEPSPFNSGFSWVLFDPQPEPPGKMFEVLTSYAARTKSTAMKMYATPLGGPNQELVTLTASESTAELRMGLGAPAGGTSSLISMLSDGTTSQMQVIGAQFGPTVPPSVVLISDAAGASVGIGTDTPTQALHVVGNICYTGTIGACSDAAFKENVEPINGALEAIEHLNGVRYSLKVDEFPERHFSQERQVGLIAQEVKEVVPEAVTLQSDGYYTVDYTRLTPVLLEAIKGLKEQNEQLVKRLEALEGKVH